MEEIGKLFMDGFKDEFVWNLIGDASAFLICGVLVITVIFILTFICKEIFDE